MEDKKIQKEPTPREARPEPYPYPPDDDNRFRRPYPIRNPMALTAFRLGAFAIMLLLINFQGGYFFGPLLWWMPPLLGPAAVIFGILGVRYRNRHPTAGGLGDAVCGIVMGLLTVLFYLGLLFWFMNHLPGMYP